jgi:Domain of unknown function (DUF4384)
LVFDKLSNLVLPQQIFLVNLSEVIMIHQYDRYEADFLKSVANELNLGGLYGSIFKARVSRKFAGSSNTSTDLEEASDFLKAAYPNDKIREGRNVRGDISETLRAIKKSIEKQGWSLDDNNNDTEIIKNWKKLTSFLQDTYFPKWYEKYVSVVSTIEPWDLLWEKVTSDDGISIINRTKKLDIFIPELCDDEEIAITFSWNEEIRYEITSKKKGFLTLIYKNSTGKILLLSPSFLIENYKSSSLDAETTHHFPRCPGRYYLPLKSGITGVDYVIAIISEDRLSFSWTKDETQKPPELNQDNLSELLRFIEDARNYDRLDIIGTRYRIVAPEISTVVAT